MKFISRYAARTRSKFSPRFCPQGQLGVLRRPPNSQVSTSFIPNTEGPQPLSCNTTICSDTCPLCSTVCLSFARSRVPLPVPPIKVKPLSQLLAFKRILSPGFKASPGPLEGGGSESPPLLPPFPPPLPSRFLFLHLGLCRSHPFGRPCHHASCPRHANCRCPILHRHPSSRQNSSHRHLHPILTLQLRNLTSLCHSSQQVFDAALKVEENK